MFYLNINSTIDEKGDLVTNCACSGIASIGDFKEVMERTGKQLARLIRETADKMDEGARYDFVMTCACKLNADLMQLTDELQPNQ